MESAKYTIEEAAQVIQELDFGEYTCNINLHIKKRLQKKLFHVEKTDGQGQK